MVWRHSYRGTVGLIFVIDATDRERIRIAHAELYLLLTEPSLASCPLLIMANKQDEPGAMDRTEVQHVQSRHTCAPCMGGACLEPSMHARP